MRTVVVIGLVAALGASAHADDGAARLAARVAPDHDREPATIALRAAPEIGDDLAPPRPMRRSVRQQLETGVTDLGFEMNAHLDRLSFGLVGLRLDGRGRTADVRLGRMRHGEGATVAGHVTFARGYARIDTRINVRLFGVDLDLDLPDVEVVPRSDFGDHYVEVRVPIIELPL